MSPTTSNSSLSLGCLARKESKHFSRWILVPVDRLTSLKCLDLLWHQKSHSLGLSF